MSESDTGDVVVMPSLAEKHARRLWYDIKACGCPKPDEEFGGLWCAACVDRRQIAELLTELAELRSGAEALVQQWRQQARDTHYHHYIRETLRELATDLASVLAPHEPPA